MKKAIKAKSKVKLVRLHLRPATEGVTLSMSGAATATKPFTISKDK